MYTDDVKLFLQESNHIEDVWDYDSYLKAFEAWKYLKRQHKLTEKSILHTHKILMEGKLPCMETGHWRMFPIWIGGHEGKPWYAVPELMKQWIDKANLSVRTGKYTGEEDLQEDHVEFEAIHPFADGNGRTGRILMNWQRVKIGKPILVIYEKYKYEYYKWFQ